MIELASLFLGRRPILASTALAILVVILRLALLPAFPIPVPAVSDEFSYLLAADTFAHGRLTNPTPDLPDFFETEHVLIRPTYASKYFPGQGLFLALGELLGHPWYGVLLSCALMAAAILWAAFGWLPPKWALFASALILPLGLFSPFVNCYWGGAVAGLGGALVTGSAGRLLRRRANAARYAAILALGSIILCYTRPLEGLALLIPLFIFLLLRKIPVRAWIIIVAIGALGAGWLAYYSYRVTGHPLHLPEAEFQRQYGIAPFVTFMSMGTPKHLLDPHMDLVHNTWERDLILSARSKRGMFERARLMVDDAVMIVGYIWVYFPVLVLFAPWTLRDRRMRPLLIAVAAGVVVGMVEIYYMLHYAAPFAAAVAIVAAQSYRHLRQAKFGRLLALAVPIIAFSWMLATQAREWIEKDEVGDPYAFAPPPGRRVVLEQSLDPAKRHIIFVRYEQPYQLHAHWIYNSADIDSQAIIWARDLGPRNIELLRRYPNRDLWLLRPNQDPNSLDPYKQ